MTQRRFALLHALCQTAWESNTALLRHPVRARKHCFPPRGLKLLAESCPRRHNGIDVLLRLHRKVDQKRTVVRHGLLDSGYHLWSLLDPHTGNAIGLGDLDEVRA